MVLDNYDSFTYNLVQLIENITLSSVDVYKNDEIHLELVKEYDFIVISPGPGLPFEAGLLMKLIETYASSKNIFGICLGMQAIAQHYGTDLKQHDKVYHGIQSIIKHNGSSLLFNKVPEEFEAGRYHSWSIDEKTMPSSLEVLAVDQQQNIMSIKHKTESVFGVQFHPESIMTKYGKTIMENFLSLPLC